jgi:hypothetical protein
MIDYEYERIVDEIQRISDEQRTLYSLAANRELTDHERKRLKDIRTKLPLLWMERENARTQYQDPLDKLIDSRYLKAA